MGKVIFSVCLSVLPGGYPSPRFSGPRSFPGGHLSPGGGGGTQVVVVTVISIVLVLVLTLKLINIQLFITEIVD